VYVSDAGKSASVLRNLLSPARTEFLTALAADYEKARVLHEELAERRVLISLESARKNKAPIDWAAAKIPAHKSGITQYDEYPLEELVPLLDWNEFCAAWELKSADAVSERKKLIDDAQIILADITAKKLLTLKAVAGFFPALSENEDVIVYDDAPSERSYTLRITPADSLHERARFCFLRNQHARVMAQSTAATNKQKPAPKNVYNLCLSDFILPRSIWGTTGAPSCDWLGLFAVSAGFGLDAITAQYRRAGDDYSALLASSLADHLAEAFAEKLQRELCDGGIRPAFGYAACPDHEDKRLCFSLLEAEARLGLALTDSAMIQPAASICGMYFTHPDAHYFAVGKIDGGQLESWARRKGISIDEARLQSGSR
jgi:5-methyltetrahydrofolate--homocysteine methyltransferase